MKASQFLKNLKKVQEEELFNIKGVGSVLANNFNQFLDSPRYHKLIEDFMELEKNNRTVNIKEQTVLAAIQTLANEVICITGTFDIPRPQIKDQLEARGAKVTNTVSSSTTILIAGENAGSKLQKAEQFGTKILSDYKNLLS